jgi:hypothetical protein
VAPELLRTGFDSPELLGTTFLADAAQLLEIAGDEPPLVDDRPGRLTPFAPPGLDPLYARLMQVDGARERFARSPFIRRVWPPALRERTLLGFERQAILNRRFLEPPSPLRYADAARLLEAPGRSRAWLLWLLDSDDDEQRLAARAAARGLSDPLVERTLGIGALADGDPPAALRLFAEAGALAPGRPELRALEALAAWASARRESRRAPR